MAGVLMVGSGVAGLVGGMLLARDGHAVTVLERDPTGAPESPPDAWERWERRGVAQFRMIHLFLAPFRQVLDNELPAVVDALEQAGVLRANVALDTPVEITGGPRPGDERYGMITGRRPVIEAGLAAAAASVPGLTIRRGVAVKQLLADRRDAGVPHVAGVVTEGGEEIRADLVIDASGRRSAAPRWLAQLGGPAPVEELDESGFIYYGRHYRSETGELPVALGPPVQHYDSFSVLTLAADNGTWGVGVIAAAGDAPLRALRDPGRWEAVVRACPLMAHWTTGAPISGIDVMAGIEDRIRHFVVDGRPVVTGLLPLADAWACTNPSVGRGASLAALHAVALRDHLRSADLGDPDAVAVGWSELTSQRLEPHYRGTVRFDRHRLAEIDAQIAGTPYETPDPLWRLAQALETAASKDPDLFRVFLDARLMLRPEPEILTEPGLADRVIALGGEPEPPPGPSRADLLALASGERKPS